jgi:hypothetical protein
VVLLKNVFVWPSWFADSSNQGVTGSLVSHSFSKYFLCPYCVLRLGSAVLPEGSVGLHGVLLL